MEIKYVSINQAAHLLGICRQRVQQLVYAGRIKGAFKKGRFWKIPLNQYNMPEVIPADRGIEGTWRKRTQKAAAYIGANRHTMKANYNQEEKEPILGVKRGNSNKYCCYWRYDNPQKWWEKTLT